MLYLVKDVLKYISMADNTDYKHMCYFNHINLALVKNYTHFELTKYFLGVKHMC